MLCEAAPESPTKAQSRTRRQLSGRPKRSMGPGAPPNLSRPRQKYGAPRCAAWRASRIARAAVIHEQKGLSPERRRRVHLADGAVGEAQPLLAHAQVADLAGEEEKRGREAEQGIAPPLSQAVREQPSPRGDGPPPLKSRAMSALSLRRGLGDPRRARGRGAARRGDGVRTPAADVVAAGKGAAVLHHRVQPQRLRRRRHGGGAGRGVGDPLGRRAWRGERREGEGG